VAGEKEKRVSVKRHYVRLADAKTVNPTRSEIVDYFLLALFAAQ
jgi:hypothetical protein